MPSIRYWVHRRNASTEKELFLERDSTGLSILRELNSHTLATSFRSDIEGLRCIAIFLVVACHCGIGWFRGGYIGVDVFFVLSGFLITDLLVKEFTRTSTVSLKRFYARRVRRLLPAFALVLLTTLSAGYWILSPRGLSFAARASRAAALYVSNVFFDRNASDYFSPAIESNPLLHTWSLGVEEQFYLFWPTILLLALRPSRTRRALAGTLILITIASLVACVSLTLENRTFAFYQLPTRSWEFAAGGLLALLPSVVRPSHKGPAIALGWMGLSAVVIPAAFLSSASQFPGWIATIPVFGTVATIAGGSVCPKRGVGRVLALAPLQFIGARSYSWYLWHWPILVFAMVLIPTISVFGKILTAGFALTLASISYSTLERPIRDSEFLAEKPTLSLWLGGVATVGLALCATFALYSSTRIARNPVMRPITTAVDDVADLSRQLCVSQGLATDALTCSFGDAQSSKVMVLFGDSHAIQWFNAVKAIADNSSWKLITLVKSGCPAVGINLDSGSFPQTCAIWRSHAIAYIQEVNPSVVLVGSYTEKLARRDAAEGAPSLQDLTDASRSLFAQLGSPERSVLEFRDVPIPPFDVPDCLARSAAHGRNWVNTCRFSRSDALNDAVFMAERRGASGVRNIHFLDLTDQICGPLLCDAARNGTIIYRDANHLTGTFAGSLSGHVDALMKAALADGSHAAR